MRIQFKRIYLIGGFMINDNYGDVIQAKLWVDWYKKNNWSIVFICHKSGFDICKNVLNLSDSEIVTVEQFLLNIPESKFLHMYGGGYLNKYWFGDFLKVISHAKKHGLKIFATGVQVDDVFISVSKEFHIDYISVRDVLTKKIVNQKSLITDDSFGYFYINRHRHNFSKYFSSYLNSNKVLLQLSLNSYVFDGIDERIMIDSIRSLILDLGKKYKLVFCSSFPEHVKGILENRRLIDRLELNQDDYSYKTTMEIDRELINNYKFFVINSFHTYIMTFFKTSRPIFYLAYDSYYKQKATALKNYGILNDGFLINSPSDLNSVVHADFKDNFSFNKELIDNRKEFSRVLLKTSEKLNSAS